LPLYAEKLYYNELKPQSIFKLARSGIHSRFALFAQLEEEKQLQLVQSPEAFSVESNPGKQYDLPKYANKQDLKCFAVTKDQVALYPVLVSYFTKKSLIPFCDEMFKAKLLDLGNAYKISKHGNAIIQTRQYRAPEVILRCQYNERVDEFSAACVIFEMLTGCFLFQTRQNSSEAKRDKDHLEQIIKICGSKGLDKLLQNADPQTLQDIQKFGKLQVCEQTPISAILIN